MTKKLDRETAVKLDIPVISNAYPTIVEFMEYHNITTEDLAKRCLMNPNYLQSILENDVKMTTLDAVHIEAVTGISANLLLNLDLAGLKQAYDKFPEELKLERYDFVKGESDESNQ